MQLDHAIPSRAPTTSFVFAHGIVISVLESKIGRHFARHAVVCTEA